MLLFARASSTSEPQDVERCLISIILHSCWINSLCHAKTNLQLPHRANCRWHKSSNPKSPRCHSWAGITTLDGLTKSFAFHKCINICKVVLFAKYFGPDPWVQLCLTAYLVLPSCQDKLKLFKRVRYWCMWPYRNPGNFCAETSSEDQCNEWPKFNQPKGKQLSPHIPSLKPLTDVRKIGPKEVWAQAAIQDQLLFPFIARFTSASPRILDNAEMSLCLFVCWRSKEHNWLAVNLSFLLTTTFDLLKTKLSLYNLNSFYGVGTAPSLWCPFSHRPTETSQAGTAV